MITINFDIPREIIIVPERKAIIDTVNVNVIIDNSLDKVVIARIDTNFESRDIIIWSGNDYDNIGQWTDDDVIDRIKEIL